MKYPIITEGTVYHQDIQDHRNKIYQIGLVCGTVLVL